MLKSLKSSLKNTLIYGVGNLAIKLVGFILIPIYVKYFSTAVYGVLGLLEVSGIALTSVLGLALTQALYRLYWDEEFTKKRKSMFFTLISFLACFLTLVVYISHFFTSNISYAVFGDSQYKDLILLVFISSSLQILVQTISTLIQLQQKATLFTIANISTLAIQLSFTIYFIVYKGLGLTGIFYAQIISYCAYFLMILFFLLKNIKVRFEFMILKSMLAYSLPWLISNIAALVLTISDRYFIRVFGVMGDLGVYQFGYKITNTLSVLIIASAQMAIFPMMFKKMNDPDAKRYYSKILTYFTFGVMFFVLFLNLYGLEIIKLLARKQEYWAAVGIIPFISLGLIFSMLKDQTSMPLQIVKKPGLISKIIITSAIFSLFLNWVFIPKYGSIGAAISFVISQFFYLMLMLFFAQKNYKVNYETIKVVKIIVVGILLFFISQLLAGFPLIARLLLKLLLIIVFPILLYFLNFYEQIELNSLKSFWIKWKNPFKIKSNIQELIKGGNQ